jgi:phage baseplate assembly protein W
MKNAEHTILGTGWSFPPTFSRAAASVAMVSDETDVRQALWNLFSTAPGERVMLPEYGCALWRLVFRSVNTAFKTEAAAAVRQAVLHWEPRIDVDAVTVEADPAVAGLVVVTLSYTLRRTNSRGNLVFPFYPQEGTLVEQGR